MWEEGLPAGLWHLQHPATCLSAGVPAAGAPLLQVDARALVRELLRLHFGAVLAVGQACVLASTGGHRLLLRVTSANVLDEAAREEALGYHCFRGERRCGLAGRL